MDNKRILILGGYGNTGRPSAEHLLRETAVHLILAGRNLARAKETAGQPAEKKQPMEKRYERNLSLF